MNKRVACMYSILHTNVAPLFEREKTISLDGGDLLLILSPWAISTGVVCVIGFYSS